MMLIAMIRLGLPFLLVMILGVSAFDGHAESRSIDMLDYLLQKDDADESWIIGGSDVRPAADPEGTDVQAWVMTKFGNAACYEVFKVTTNQVQSRFEVFRAHAEEGRGNWIRRFEAINGEGNGPGAVWCLRFMIPGGEGFLSSWRQDRFEFDMTTHSYVFDPKGSGEMKSWVSLVWATNDWGANNKTGFDLRPVLRRIDQWQVEGKIFETYDYAFRKGLVAWRWYERVSSLPPMEGDPPGKIFHCENGFVEIATRASATNAPVVFKFDPSTKTRIVQLEVMRFKSHWRPERGEDWYVIYRDSIREGPLIKQSGQVEPAFALPEWKIEEKATIANLKYVNTHPPAGVSRDK